MIMILTTWEVREVRREEVGATGIPRDRQEDAGLGGSSLRR